MHYETQEAANLAVTKVNGMLLNGKKVFVGFFVPRKDRSGGSEANDSFTNVYVKNLAPDVEDEKLDELFKAHGPIKSAIVMKDGEGKSRGFGFVNFEEHEHAAQACEALNNTEVNGKAMFVGRAQKKRDRERELRDKFEALKVERANKFTGVNLFVKNLDDNVDDEKLREAFTPFGTISSAKVMSDEKGTSKGFGFVCFDSQEEATKAVSEMNGHILANKPLYVALAQRKEERKNILEQQHQTRSSNGMGRMQRGPDGGMPGQAVAYPGAPFFYSPQQMPQQRGGPGFMYPQQMMMRPAPGAYQQMGQYGGAMAMGNRAGGGRMQQGGRGPQGAGNLRGPNKQGGQMQQRQGFPQRPGGPPPGQPGAPQGQPGAPMGQPGAPMPGGPMGQPPQMAPQEINAATLAAAPPEQQKQLLGERLFPLIENVEPHLAGKITGMLLEVDNSELLNFLESPDALNAKIIEALSVLQIHSDNVPIDPRRTQTHTMPVYICLDATDGNVEREVLSAACEVRMLGAKCVSDLNDSDLEAADVVAVWHTIWLDEALLGRLKRCRAIIRMGVGYDNVDTNAAAAAGLPVCNIPDYGTEEVADTAMVRTQLYAPSTD